MSKTRPQPSSPEPTVSTVEAALRRNYATRLHMSLIILACIASAVVTSRILHVLGVQEMWVRYPFALLVAYGVFFLGVWSWLLFSPYGRYLRRQRDDGLNLDGDFSNIGGVRIYSDGSTPVDTFSGGGGEFDGGGASGDFDGNPTPMAAAAMQDSGGSGAGSSSGSGFKMPDIDVGGDGEGCALIIAGILALVALSAIFGSAIFIIYEAPHILAEVIFQVMLGSTMLRGVRAIESASWQRALFAATWKPYAIVITLSMVFAIYCSAALPEVHSVGQLFGLIMQKF